MSPENLRLRFFGVSRRSAELAADRAASGRPGYRALVAEDGDRILGLAEYETEPGTGPTSACGSSDGSRGPSCAA